MNIPHNNVKLNYLQKSVIKCKKLQIGRQAKKTRSVHTITGFLILVLSVAAHLCKYAWVKQNLLHFDMLNSVKRK